MYIMTVWFTQSDTGSQQSVMLDGSLVSISVGVIIFASIAPEDNFSVPWKQILHT